MLGLKLNHVSKRGHMCFQNALHVSQVTAPASTAYRGSSFIINQRILFEIICFGMADDCTEVRGTLDVDVHLTPVMLNLFLGNVKIYSHFLWFLDPEISQVVKFLSHGRWGPVYLALSIPWLVMTWRHKEPGHQWPQYWPGYHGIFRFQYQTSLRVIMYGPSGFGTRSFWYIYM